MSATIFSAYLGLGSNLAGVDSVSRRTLNSKQWLEFTVDYLRQHASITTLNQSEIFTSNPMGPQDQPVYANTCVRIETSLVAEELLDLTQSIEARAGRERKRHWGERALDLDILNHIPLYNHNNMEFLQRLKKNALMPIIQSERLTLPHPQLHLRDFVLLPLQQVIREDWSLDINALLNAVEQRFIQN